ncbi:hypothetical protein MNV49_003968 [Pseudohyphozyma bogoriensis]|nr:hypothetical protein MNV49_003968 [Pseudohyphozyma bogoriensis]
MAPKKDSSNKGALTQRLKIVVRRLPPDLPEPLFWRSVAPWVARETTTTDADAPPANSDNDPATEASPQPERAVWTQFRQGKVRRSGKDKDDVHSRAYIVFQTPDALVAFHRAYDGWSFRDKQGNITQAVVEFAPYQRIPTTAKQDARQGTIDTDKDFLEFEKCLSQAEPMEKPDEEFRAPTTTPLLDHLRAQKAAELAARRSAQAQASSSKAASKKAAAAAAGGGAKNRKTASKERADHAKGKAGWGKKAGKEKEATPGTVTGAAFPAIGETPAPPPAAGPSGGGGGGGGKGSRPPSQQRPPRPPKSAPPPTPQIQLLTRPQSTANAGPSPTSSGTSTPNPQQPQKVRQGQTTPQGGQQQQPKDVAAQRRQLGAALGAVLGDGTKKRRGGGPGQGGQRKDAAGSGGGAGGAEGQAGGQQAQGSRLLD